MHKGNDGLIFSATDLSGFLACSHLALLDRAAAHGELRRPHFDDPGLDLLRQRGEQHERNYLDRLRNAGHNVVEIIDSGRDLPSAERWRRLAAASIDAMRAGADVIYQAALFDGTWLGKADFLLRVDTPGAFGAWSYEVVDTKLAREAKGGALLQVLLYSDLLAAVQHVAPEHVHIALGGPEPRTERFRVADYAAYYRSIRARFEHHLRSAAAAVPAAVEPVEHCGICAWSTVCDRARRDVDHLSLVAGISRSQRQALTHHDIVSLEALASTTAASIPEIGAAAYERIRNQARVQLEGRRAQRPVHELLEPVVQGEGLGALPEPTDGDLFFDLEGDPYALTDGIEYLFGVVDTDGIYTCTWALDRAAEKHALVQFIDRVTELRARYPDMHVYHYNHYETTALKKLVGRYGTRELELDRLLRGDVFVDLLRVVRQGIRASVESYSIKKLEPFYNFKRDVDLAEARAALAGFEAWLELGGARQDGDVLRAAIEGYNRDDCVSTRQLRTWLESLRASHPQAPLPRPLPPDPGRSEKVEERNAEAAALIERLTDDVPADADARTDEQHARWLLAQLLEYHRREDKAMWWEYFRCLALSDDELVEDRATLGDLEYEGVVGTVARSLVHRYRFPPQDYAVRVGKGAHDPKTKQPAGRIEAIDDVACTIDLKRGANSPVPHPRALVLMDDIDEKPLRESLLRIAADVLENGLGATRFQAAAQLLLAEPPRLTGGDVITATRDAVSTLDAALRLTALHDRTVIPVQGPPGSGKTFTGAHAILQALDAGKRVGVTALGHKVISNLLDRVCTIAAQEGRTITGIQKATDTQRCNSTSITAVEDNDSVREALERGDIRLAAGTGWLWSREDMIASVDILFVDEASQFPLANALAVSPAATSIVLLGDPRQLEQPQQGVHPPGAGVSALEHLLRGQRTIPPDRGLFLPETRRLHPDICAFTSEIFYDSRLAALPGLERQRINGAGVLNGTGLRYAAVEHVGNTSESLEEVDVVTELVHQALASTWTDREGKVHAMTLGDVRVVAPYNVQVAALRAALPDGAHVGTVDRFQGQEAALVIYSMATSTAADAPRGMDFLYSPNRLNVATSRARCLAIVVASPALFVPDCRSPAQMRLANAFCRFLELSGSTTEGLAEIAV